MRTKQSAIRRLANNSEDEDEATEVVLLQPQQPQQQQQQPQLQSLPLNGQDNQPQPQPQQLEDGTVVVQPEAAEATDDSQATCFDQASSSGARCTAPGIYDTIKCTACGKKVNPYNGTMQVHPMLKVLVCQKCYKFYASGHFDADEEGKENQCRWCGEGGSLICCDNCEHSFCRTCIKRNLGRSALQDIESLPEESVWLCYACDQGALRHLQEEASIVMKAVRDHFKEVNKRSEKQKVSLATKKAVAAHVQHHQQQHQHHQQLHRPTQPVLIAPAVPVIATAAPVPAIAAYGSVRDKNAAGLQSATIGGIHLDLSAVPGVGTAARAAQQPHHHHHQQQQPHRQQHHHHHPHLLQQHQPQQQPTPASVSQRTEQWYKQNVRIETILNEIELVDTRNIHTALNATVSLLQGMMRQYSRFLQDLSGANTQLDKAQIVSRFKSAYRMHLFLRLGKLRSLIAEADKHNMRKSAARVPAQPGVSTAAIAAVNSGFIDLTESGNGGGGSGASAKAARPGLLLPLSARVASAAAASVPQPLQAQPGRPVLPPPRQQQQQQQPQQPPEVVVLSDDDDDDDDTGKTGNAGNGTTGGGNENHNRDRGSATESDSSAAVGAASASAATAASNSSSGAGGKPAAILELLEARRRREKCSRKSQQPRKIFSAASASAPTADVNGNEEGEAPETSEAEAEASGQAAELLPASPLSSSSSTAAAAAGVKRPPPTDPVEGEATSAAEEEEAPSSEKRPRQESAESPPQPQASPTPPPEASPTPLASATPEASPTPHASPSPTPPPSQPPPLDDAAGAAAAATAAAAT